MPACIGESDRSSSHTCSAVGWPQSWPSRAASSQTISMSSRAWPGGSSARRTRCTRRSLFVTVPSASHQLAEAGSTTSASSAVRVRKMSCTTRWSSPSSRCSVCTASASDCAGFSPTTYSAFSSRRSIASNICGQVPAVRGWMVTPQACSYLARASWSLSMSWKPGSLLGIAPMSPPPCTLFWPRSGLRPEP